MKGRYLLANRLLIILLVTPLLIFASEKEAKVDLKTIANQQMQKVNMAFHMKSDLFFVDKGDIHAVGGKGIYINLSILTDMIQGVDSRFLDNIIFLILAHEQTHLIQFDRGLNIKTDNEWQKVLECQADILGSEYFTEMLAENTPALVINYRKPNEDELFNTCLQLFYSLGEDNLDNRTHPYKEQRRTAIKTGRDCGFEQVLDKYLAKNKTAKKDDQRNEAEQRLQFYKTVSYFQVEDKDDFAWTLKLAKQIIHYQIMVAKNVILYENEPEWNATFEHPYSHFLFGFKNKNSVAVKISLQVKNDYVLRADPENSLLSYTVKARNYHISLPAGDSVFVEDSLQWTNSLIGNMPKSYMPAFVSPSNPNSLFSIEFPNDAQPTNDSVNQRLVSLVSDEGDFKKKQGIIANDVLPSLIEIVRTDPKELKMLISGIGREYYYEKPDYGTRYNLITPYSDIVATFPHDTAGLPEINYDMFKSVNREQATTYYQTILKDLVQHYQSDISTNKILFSTEKDENVSIYSSFLINSPKDKISAELSRNKLPDSLFHILFHITYVNNKTGTDLKSSISFLIDKMPTYFQSIRGSNKQFLTKSFIAKYMLPNAIDADIYNSGSSWSYNTTTTETSDNQIQLKKFTELEDILNSLLPSWQRKTIRSSTGSIFMERWNRNDNQMSVSIVLNDYSGIYRLKLSLSVKKAD